MDGSIMTTEISTLRIASPSGTLQARVVHPAILSGQAPLVVLHGISRNADELTELFVPEARRTGRIVVIPHFSRADWPNFQRPSRAARPDLALLALLERLAVGDRAFAGPVDLFGHSGGAQLAHRFAMLYPQRVGRLTLSAAGWYCMPDEGMAYPCGLGADAAPGSRAWTRRLAAALPCYLRLPVRVFVGTRDTERDDSLRQTRELDRLQGPTRIQRAETYVRRFRAAAEALGIRPEISLTRLPGVTHDVGQAIRQAGLARLVAAEPARCLAAAS